MPLSWRQNQPFFTGSWTIFIQRLTHESLRTSLRHTRRRTSQPADGEKDISFLYFNQVVVPKPNQSTMTALMFNLKKLKVRT